MFKPISLYYTDGYKVGHKRMLAPGTTRLYGTWIPRSLNYAPTGVTKVVSFGQQLVVRWLHDEFEEHFFSQGSDVATKFGEDMSKYLNLPYDSTHFEELHALQYLPIRIKALPEGLETPAGIPHMTFVNTVDGFAWLTLYLETIISSLAWKPATSATIALQYRRNLYEWVKKTDEKNMWLIDYLAHDFSARGLSPWDMLSSGLGHATSFRGSDTLMVIPGSRYFYGMSDDEVCINSVNASEHSVSTTKIFTVGELQMIADWLDEFPEGFLSIVADTFDLWKLITEYLPILKDKIMARPGRVVIRPDSGNPVDIICGEAKPWFNEDLKEWRKSFDGNKFETGNEPAAKGVIELLWDIFGGTTNDQGFKVLDPHIGAIYGDSITLDRQVEIYRRLEAKGFATTNIVLGVGSFTYQMNTRDTLGWAAKGAWFEVREATGVVLTSMPPKKEYRKVAYNIYKDPVTDNGAKKSLKGLIKVYWLDAGTENAKIVVQEECTWEEESQGLLQTIYENGKFFNQVTLTEVRERLQANDNTQLSQQG